MAVDLAIEARERGIKYFLISFVDLFGTLRAKLAPASAIADMAKEGAGFAGFAMFVAAFVRHKAHLHLLVAVGGMRASEETLRSWGNPELALLYLLVFAVLALTGGGRFSLERVLRRWR